MKKLFVNVLFALGVSVLGSHFAHANNHMGHGDGAGMPPFAQAYKNLHKKLNLTPEQDATWKKIHEQHQKARGEHQQAMKAVHEALKAELTKTDPDFDKVQKLREDAQDKHHASQKAFYADVNKFYTTLNPTQKTMVREQLKVVVDKMEQRQAMHGKRQEMMKSN